MSSQFNNAREVASSRGEFYNSGEKSVNYRLGLVRGMGSFGLTSTKVDIDNSQFWSNEYGIPVNGLDITFAASAITLGIASTSVNDTSAGTGARVIIIFGLNSNYDAQQEIVSLNGQTEVNTIQQFLRVNVVQVISVGSLGYNEGTIYIGGSDNSFVLGEPDLNVYRTIGVDTNTDNAGINISTNSTYTIPRNHTAVAIDFKVATDATSAKPLLVRGIVKLFGGPEIIFGNLNFNGSQEFQFGGFGALPERTDVIVRTRAKTASSVDECVVFWEYVQKKNDINPNV